MIRYVTGTILANITAHILFNGTSYAISAISAVKGAAAPWITIVLFAVGIVLFLVGTAGLRKEYQKKMLRGRTILNFYRFWIADKKALTGENKAFLPIGFCGTINSKGKSTINTEEETVQKR